MKKNSVAIITVLIIAICFYLFYKEGTLSVNKNDKSTKIFVIGRGESLNQVANNLSKNDLIRNKLVFYLVVKRLGIEKKIQAGDFRLSPSMDAYQIAKTLTHGTLDVWMTIIEGLRKEEIAQVVSKDLDIPEIEFLKEVKEGYLFPDTYLIPSQATTGGVIEIFVNNLYRRFNERLRKKAEEKGLTEKEVLILASLVEKEARHDEDRQKVASIILKRLKNDIKLQIDATVQYALGYQSEEKTWWKKNLTQEDLDIDSPYNTYKNEGLPPGPIANPGLASIEAVINADANTSYLYYISDKNGNMHYARTLEEHQANIDKYLQ
ncbi:endolytic transglycosylase MltG [Candidatus Roizmanbacteria bacterium CG02_land_8_20_14_3_00_36_15]|uniref:Endolytic murein transglycosylase n=2 Tax=Candidatus Roizmaniibacteriota TaxID=1752723 RepID=A0A2M8KJV4_9BACT|nr:MAG: endolytic transglycosylase MltG [Candidatus Roizmanbacteria bacterium CG03_land_8_20_14_0_80_36_21]PIV38182.1 MAG: endolytic transglycosylase MltG [Candidatus Roizmanbacteria bacterium CG02_land_8_20_14_3_00_36_15]PIY69572.1 MAG: endolytic transglycosylase MltG [Candidatus Roizmanbacteria bacterium CG_4_10_14_0_8_um_filter_36_36]PJA53737.1 MAG: endolytic transglycosylase MltG [Candidatus Roizmanbacteria bacterium CG_4_9_14_3_um_filter_36_11]PJC81640.1 MAG: endolytic transglycosylase Mlt